MKNKIILTVIILIGLSSIIFAQQKFRSAIFLHRSVGGKIYDQGGANTSVPEEYIAYNIAHSYTGTDAVSMNEVLFPWNNSGNAWYEWRAVFDGTDPDDDIYQYINAYDIIIIKNCYTVGIASYWIDGPQDTTNYPDAQTYYNYQWHLRHVLGIMENHPDKFFVMWTPATYTPQNTPVGGYILGNKFSHWMTDTLAAGLDATYGAFPDNVHIFDYFHDIDSLTMLPLSLAVSPTDNHPNAAATDLIAPLFVNDVFDAAIAYESVTGGIVSADVIPDKYTLEQNYPNPFNPVTTIRFNLPEAGNVKLKVYNILGKEIRTLVNEYKESGIYTINFTATNLNSGMYIYKIEANGFIQTRKMTLLK